LGLILACAFAASTPTIIAKTLKPPIKARFMIFSFRQLTLKKKHGLNVPSCQVKFSLNIAPTCLLARNENSRAARIRRAGGR
jgi:hypothetical protein